MLGVAPSPPPANALGTIPASEPESPPTGDFQPFAPVPGTLAGLNAAGIHDEQPQEPLVEPVPHTLTGLSDPARGTPQHPARTLMGFGAWPNVASAESAETNPPLNTTDPGGSSGSGTPQSPLAEPNPPEAAKPALHATIMGVSPISANDPTAAGSAPTTPAQLNGTLLGVSPLCAPPPMTAKAEQVAVGSTTLVTAPGAPAAPLGPQQFAHATMLGVAPPPAAAMAHPGKPAEAANVPPIANQSTPHVNPHHKGTLLGVAMPGIAPLQPGLGKPGEPPPGTATYPLQVSANPKPRRQASDSDILRESAQRAQATRSGQQRRLAWVFGTAAALLVVLIVVALGVWWTSVHLAVTVTTSESGNENLVLTCTNCPDGTNATVESKTATFRSSRATIELARRLSIGENELTLQVVRPNRTRGETVTVTVPVEFRVTSSVAELAGDPPVVAVECTAAPGTRFVVDGQSSLVGPSGQLKVPIDVSAMLTGHAAAVMPFERSIAYEVVREDLSTKGTLVVRTGITPLEIATPGSTHITQNPTFSLSGRTSVQGKITANGHSIAVAANGTFLQEMALSAPGATKLYVRAQEANLAPRLVEISLERVTNLRQRADELARPLPSDFDAISALAVTKPDSLVALHAEVVDIESAGGVTRLVATSRCKQGPCLSSVRHAGALALRRGSRFIAIGKARMTPRPSTTENDLALDASLVVEDSDR